MQLQPGLYAHRKRGKKKKKTILAWHRAPIEHCFMPWASQIDDTVIALSANSSAMSLADITFDAIFYVTFVCLCLGMLCSHVSYTYSASVKIGRTRIVRRGNKVRTAFFWHTSTTRTSAGFQIHGWCIGHASWKKGLWTCIIQKTRLAYCSKLDKKGNSFNYANNLAHMMLIAWANFFHQILRWYFISRNPQRPNRKCLATCQPMLLHVIWVYLPGNFQSISVPQTTEMALGEIVNADTNTLAKLLPALCEW